MPTVIYSFSGCSKETDTPSVYNVNRRKLNHGFIVTINLFWRLI